MGRPVHSLGIGKPNARFDEWLALGVDADCLRDESQGRTFGRTRTDGRGRKDKQTAGRTMANRLRRSLFRSLHPSIYPSTRPVLRSFDECGRGRQRHALAHAREDATEWKGGRPLPGRGRLRPPSTQDERTDGGTRTQTHGRRRPRPRGSRCAAECGSTRRKATACTSGAVTVRGRRRIRLRRPQVQC